jgi:hypothetical protein
MSSSSTAAVTSDVTARLQQAVDESQKRLTEPRRASLQELAKRLRDLERRGLLRRQSYSAPSPDDLRRLYQADRSKTSASQ